MSGMTQLKQRPEHLKGATYQAEQRRTKRVSITLLGRFMRALTREEATCRLVDISIGGASLLSDTAPQLGEQVVIQFEELGGLEANVIRVVPGGFAVQFTASHRRRQKLAAQITWLLNRHELAAADQRRPGHDRIAITPKPIRIKLADGSFVERNVIDVSISGASIDIEERPNIGDKILVGRLPATVVRHHKRGIGVEFDRIQDISNIKDHFS
jgi:PilZ domain